MGESPLSESRQSAALFTAALLEKRKDLNNHQRLSIISAAPSFDIHSMKDVSQGLTQAFNDVGREMTPRELPGSGYMKKLAALAEAWRKKGIKIISAAELKKLRLSAGDLSPVIFLKGDTSILQEPAGAVLNSRTGRTVGPDDGWLFVTKLLFG